jgi:putative drug exporter of the RND superfamily
MVERIATGCYRGRWAVLGGWIAFLVVISIVGGVAGGELRNNFDLPGAESQDAADLLKAGGFQGQSGESGQIVFAADAGLEDADVQTAAEDFLDEVRAEMPDDVVIVSPYDDDPRAQGLIGERTGTVGYAEVEFGDRDLDGATALAQDITAVRDEFDVPEGMRIELGGFLFVEQPEFSSESVGFLAAIVILLIAFGSVLAMGLPLVTALFGIGIGMAIVQLFAHVFDIPDFAPSGVAMISIGVGIDYALLIVTRYREELRAGRDPEAAVVRSLSTAGRSVLFAGTTVVLAMLSLLVFPTAVTQSLAVAISAGVLIVMLASLTLLPALLGFTGHNIDKLSIHRKGHTPRAGEASLWYRWSRVVQRRPWPIAIVGLAVLVLLAVPLFGMRLGFADTGNRPETDTTRQAYDLIADEFGDGYNGLLILALDLPGDDDEDTAVVERLRAGLDEAQGVDRVIPTEAPGAPLVILNDDGSVGFLQVVPTTSPQDERTDNLVNDLRDRVVPAAVEGSDADVLVGGFPAGTVDFAEFQATRLPIFIGVVLLLSFVLLMAVFRSLLVPLKAVIMNLLSIGAAYGVIVAVFQWGWLGGAFGLGREGPIESWAPMMLFAIVFGLSMDYEVFLLSRIKEEYNRSGDNATAVADGLARTARLITAAAAIMFCVFGAFVLNADRSLQLFGMGLAVAVLVDATVVRLLLVPATMELLGDRNWWIPAWLDRILPHIDVEGPEPGEPSEPDVQPTEPTEPTTVPGS